MTRRLLQVNGLDGPLLQQFGCECGRCLAPGRSANTSVSLISLDAAGQTVYHLLVDAGLGIMDSLNASPYLRGAAARLDDLVLTHWHPDHVAELNRLCVSYYNTRRRRQHDTGRVPLHCRAGTLAWLEREQNYLQRVYLEAHIFDDGEPPGARLRPLPLALPGVTMTAISVAHYTADLRPDDSGQTAYCSAAFVIETATAKAVLLWDIDSENEWLVAPETEAQAATVAFLAEADLLFIDTTFWHRPTKRATHPSFENVLRYAAILRPRHTLLMHLSGHPDGAGRPGYGWTNAAWTVAASAAWAGAGLPGTVAAPDVGDVFDI